MTLTFHVWLLVLGLATKFRNQYEDVEKGVKKFLKNLREFSCDAVLAIWALP